VRNPFGHIDLRVRDLDAARAFYARLLPPLGFTRFDDDESWPTWSAEGERPSAPFFGVTRDPSHVPNANRIAFWVGSREEVDRIGALLREIDAQIESGPRLVAEYTGRYYAVFFRDPGGNCLEVVHQVLG